MRQIKVLEVVNRLGLGAIEKTVQIFSTSINRKFFRVSVCGFFAGGEREKYFKDAGVELFLPKGNKRKLLEFTNKNGFHIIHAHENRCALINSVAPVKIQGIYFSHPLTGKEISQIDSLEFNSKNTLFNFLKKAKQPFDFDKYKVLYQPLEAIKFSQNYSKEKIKKAREKLGIKQGEFVIGRIGRPDIVKWGDMLLESVPYLVELIPQIKIALMGVPPSREREIKRGKWSNYFIFIPTSVDENKVIMFYKLIDALTHCSKIGESFGNTLVEAMATGVPIVVNSTPKADNAQIEVIKHMETGIIANHPQTYARAVFYLYKNPRIRKQMGKNGQKRAKMFDAPKLTRILEKIYIETLAKKGNLDREILNYAKKIRHFPSEKEIKDYPKEYQKLLKQEFEELSSREELRNLARWPKRTFRRLADYLEFKYVQGG